MSNATAAPGKKGSRAGLAGLALLLCFLFNAVGRGVGDTYVVFLLPLRTEFGWNRSEISSIYSVYMLATGLSAPFIGMFFDRWGPRLVYSFGLACLGCAYVLAGSLNQPWQFHLCVGVAGGIGVAALGMVPAATLISRWFHANTGTAIGIAYAGLGFGTLLMVPLAQYMTQSVGWRSTYHILGTSLLVLLPFVSFLPWKALQQGRSEGAPVSGRSPRAVAARGAPQVGPLRAALKTREFWSLAQVFGHFLVERARREQGVGHARL